MLLGNERVYDQELIYARVIRLLVSSRDTKFDDVLAYELAAYPPSMFNSEGEIKIAKSKSTLKHILQVTVSERTCPIPDIVIRDLSALLWVIPWTTDKLTVHVNNFKMFVSQALQTANVTLVSDRYFPSSIKTFTRMHRGGSTRVHKLTQQSKSFSAAVYTSYSNVGKSHTRTVYICLRDEHLKVVHVHSEFVTCPENNPE